MTTPDTLMKNGRGVIQPMGSLGSRVRRLTREESGLSSLEFALLMPVIVMLFAATLDLGEALMVNRRINQIATTTSDIVAQEPDWTDQQLKTLVDGSTSILEPFVTNPAKVQISILNVDSAGKATVGWSYGYNTAALAAGSASPVTIPKNIAESGVQIVVTVVNFEMTTTFTSLLSKVTGLSSYQLDSSALARPRISNTITHK